MGISFEPQSISDLLVNEPGFGPTGGRSPDANEQMFEGDDVTAASISGS